MGKCNNEPLQGRYELENETCYYKDGLLHREDGPAKIKYCDDKIEYSMWYRRGLLHREDGPAIEHSNGHAIWFLKGKKIKCITDGCISWYNGKGELHKEDGPAVIKENGDEEWYLNGKLHRENGLPAINYTNGVKAWYKDGILQKTEYPNVTTVNPCSNYDNYDEETKLSNTFEGFKEDVYNLINKYNSNVETIIYADFLKSNLEMFEKFIVNRNKFFEASCSPYIKVKDIHALLDENKEYLHTTTD